LPFGGVGGSGFGAYRGKHTFEVFSHFKGVMLSPTWFDLPLKYPPYGSLKFLKKFLG
jgi:aldehyde dehydrogenase (NAD+)